MSSLNLHRRAGYRNSRPSKHPLNKYYDFGQLTDRQIHTLNIPIYEQDLDIFEYEQDLDIYIIFSSQIKLATKLVLF